MKRVFDLAVSTVSLSLLAIPLALVALLIKLTSPGPVIFRQERSGQNGRPFCLYKFRTMRQAKGAHVTVGGDPRITPLGRVLRRWKIDELPQLWNVLRGDMSIVGPRPEVEKFVRHYTAEQRKILEIKPGLAGFTQLVYPHEAELLRVCPDPEDAYEKELLPKKIAVDLEYEGRRSFWSDLALFAEIILLSLGKSYRIDYAFKILPPPGTDTTCKSHDVDKEMVGLSLGTSSRN